MEGGKEGEGREEKRKQNNNRHKPLAITDLSQQTLLFQATTLNT